MSVAFDKERAYAEVFEELRSVLEGADLDRIGAMASVAAALSEKMPHFTWTGFYRVTSPEMLEIGPYQGHLACLKIPFNRGVCGASATRRESLVVDDVREFPGYIACDAKTLSEIVVPVVESGEVTAVLDVDAESLKAFDAVDRRGLEKIVTLLTRLSS